MKKFFSEREGGIFEYIIILAIIGVIICVIYVKMDSNSTAIHSNAVSNLNSGIGVETTGSASSVQPGSVDLPVYFSSCKQTLIMKPGSPSGMYTIVLSDGTFEDVYCDMTTSGGGWTRISNYDFSVDRTPPSGSALVAKDPFTSTSYSGTAIAGWYPMFTKTAFQNGGYQYTNFFANNEKINYSEVRADVDISFVWTPDSYTNTHGSPSNRMSLEGQYMDGVGVSYGEPGSRSHLFSFTWVGYPGGDARAAFLGTDTYSGSRITRTVTKTLNNSTNQRIETRVILDQWWQDEEIGIDKFVLWIR